MPDTKGRSKYRMGRLENGVWYCKCDKRPEWKTAGSHTPNAKRKYQRCATSFDDDDNDCGFFLWEDDIADAEEDMQQRAGLSSRKRTGLSSRKRTADVAGMDTEGNAGGGPSDRGRQQQHRRVGTASPTPGPSRLQIPGLERRRDDAEPQGGGGGGGDSTFDSIMGILGEWQIEVPREARLRIQAELLDQKHALEDGVLRIRQLEEKLACLHK